MEYELNRLELELEDMATSMIFAQMTIQQVDSEMLQREDTLQEVHKMRAGACRRAPACARPRAAGRVRAPLTTPAAPTGLRSDPARAAPDRAAKGDARRVRLCPSPTRPRRRGTT